MTKPSAISSADPTSPEETIQTLLRQAGRRPPVPRADAEIVRAAVHAQWEWTVRKYRRRHLLRRTATSFAVAAVLVLALGPAVQRWLATNDPAATVESVYGLLHTEAAGSLDDPTLEVGSPLPPGTTVATFSSDSEPTRAVIRLASGPSLRLDQDTTVRFDAASTVTLIKGGIYIDSGDGPGDGSAGPGLEVLTPLGKVQDIGTRFEVRLAPTREALRIRVRDGEVVLDRNDGTRHNAQAGIELSVETDGTVSKKELPALGSTWEWTQATLPAFETEGKTLGEFLLWASREGGWELVWSPGTDPESVATHILHGSIAGLSLDQALDLILLAENLNRRVQDERLIIDREE